jgi:photosystem II stability/assembly factor-like uncharacterized protein
VGRSAAAPPAAPPPATEPTLQRQAVGATEAAELAKTDATPIEISTPNEQVRWRLAGSVVQRTLDGGSTWEVLNAPGDLDAVLSAGSSPSTNVLWAVGPAGVVLVTTDGRSMRRVTFPEAADLTAVEATDATRATVTTADGRRFRTTDGGRTWTSIGGGRVFRPGV